jgi:hypothetical protein
MTYDAVIQGIIKYINKEILSTMADWQAMLARVAISRLLSNKDGFRAAITGNAFLQSMGIVSIDGMVDVDGLARDLKEQISLAGKLEIELPVFGKYVFSPDDVDTLYKYIKEVRP